MPRIQSHYLRQLLNAIDLADLISDDVELIGAGSNKKCLCAFHHENSPSMMVYRDHYYCFGCNARGSALDYLIKGKGLSFREAVDVLSARTGIPIPESNDGYQAAEPNQLILNTLKAAASGYQSVLLSADGQPGLDELAKRGIDEDSIMKFCLGFAPDNFLTLCGRDYKTARRLGWESLMSAGLAVKAKSGKGSRDFFRNRLIFPIMDERGNVLGFGGRRVGCEGPKYLNTAETEVFKKGKCFFGLYQTVKGIRKHDSVLIVEGYFDVLTVSQSGKEEVISPCGTALTKEQVKLALSLAKNLMLCFDGDHAGKQATWRAARLFAESVSDKHEVRLCRLPSGHDPDSLIRAEGIEAFQSHLDNAPTLGSYLIEEITRGANIPEKRTKSLLVAKDLIASIQHAPSFARFIQQELARALELPESELLALMSDLDEKRQAQNGATEHAYKEVDNALPCPCCTGTPLLHTFVRKGVNLYRIACSKCRMGTPAFEGKNEASSIWNCRPQ